MSALLGALLRVMPNSANHHLQHTYGGGGAGEDIHAISNPLVEVLETGRQFNLSLQPSLPLHILPKMMSKSSILRWVLE